MPITALPTPPSRQDPTNFNDRADAFLGALPLFQTEANALQTNVNTSEVNASAFAVNAAASELAAANTAGATIWVSGTTYAVGENRFSPINFLTYRRKTAGAGTTDPSLDATNWQLLTGLGDVSTSGNQTIGGVKTFSNTAIIQGLTVGRGASSVASNTAVGSSALAANTTGSNNTTIGLEALLSNTSGANNTATGVQALRNNTTGGSNTATGVQALQNNNTGGSNTAVGTSALSSNTTGSNNTAVGLEALRNNNTGLNNTATGYAALFSNTAGNHTATGYEALFSNTSGSGNTAIGFQALRNNTTGSNNTAIGYDARASSSTVSNTVTFGDSSITTLRCQVTSITSLSDVRDKTNINDIPVGLAFVQALRPVSFDWNMRDGGKVGVPEFGFIAQELQEAQINIGITIPNLVFADNPEKLEACAGTLIPVLVKAIQELSEKVKTLEEQLANNP